MTNSGAIQGANGAAGANGGTAVWNAGAITTLTNNGSIAGGAGAMGGAGVSNAKTIGTLTNSGTIGGGVGKTAGAGVLNASGATITTLTNSGSLQGANGAAGGNGGTAVWNAGAITTLTNSGTIQAGQGGAAGTGLPAGSAGDAIYSAGAAASIGTIANTGVVAGNVVIGHQSSLTVTGGSGTAFGSWSGGTIFVGAGNLTFASGNTTLADNVYVNGGTGTVTNEGVLAIASPETITGAFAATSASSTATTDWLDVTVSSATETSFALTAGAASIAGGLDIVLAKNFTLASGQTFELVDTYGALTGSFSAFELGGSACFAVSGHAGYWQCTGSSLYFDLTALSPLPYGGAVDLSVVGSIATTQMSPLGAAPLDGPIGTAVPEASTWVMLVAGFAGLGGLMRSRRTMSLSA